MILRKRIKVSEHFYLDEYVTPELYRKWGAKSVWFIRPELPKIDEFIRTRFNIAMILNNWAIGGPKYQSGLRYPVADVGAGDSMHKFGIASDNQFKGQPDSFYEEVREDIRKNFVTLYQPLGLTTIEANTPNWLHKDCRNIPDQKELNIVPIPKKK